MIRRRWTLLLLAAALLGGCGRSDGSPSGFASPEAAVDAVRPLIVAKDWRALAAKYDLSRSSEPRARLESGEFFLNADASDPPTGVMQRRVRHPFSPEFRYHATIQTADPAVVVVEMMVEIEQGEGQPVQRGYDHFKLRRDNEGAWWILPDPVSQAEAAGGSRGR